MLLLKYHRCRKQGLLTKDLPLHCRQPLTGPVTFDICETALHELYVLVWYQMPQSLWRQQQAGKP